MADGIRVTLDGLKELASRFSGLSADIEKFTKREVRIAVIEMRNNIGRKMRARGKGRERPGGKSNVSRPGDVPAKDTGRLLSSVGFNIRRGGLVARIGTNVDYGKRLEKGIGVAARPWLEPEFDDIRLVLVDRIIDAIQKAT